VPRPDWTRGQFYCRLENNKAHDLGTIEVPAELFERRRK
jgi:hypothetical protein